MAVTQISRIQHRRGLQQDLPQLTTAELGWSIDEQRLFIGNGTLEELAPSIGVTEILTQKNIDRGDLTRLLGSYQFFGNAAGYAAQTGSSSLNPTSRSIQAKLDDIVNVRDFGAVGDGTTNDTDAINRALTQIYKTPNQETGLLPRRTIYFPGGTYITSNTIQVPPNARLVGDGINSTKIQLTQGNKKVIELCDSKFLTGASIGTTGGILPSMVEIQHLTIHNSNLTASVPLISIDSAANVKIKDTLISSNTSAGTYVNLVAVSSTVQQTRNIVIDGCILAHGGNAITLAGASVLKFQVLNSTFDDISNVTVDGGSVNGYTGINNLHGNIGAAARMTSATYWHTYGENFDNTPTLNGMFLGNLQRGTAAAVGIDTTDSSIMLVTANSSGTFDYEISSSLARRVGTMMFSSNATTVTFSDEFAETATSLSANLFLNDLNLRCSLASGTATFKYALKKFN